MNPTSTHPLDKRVFRELADYPQAALAAMLDAAQITQRAYWRALQMKRRAEYLEDVERTEVRGLAKAKKNPGC